MHRSLLLPKTPAEATATTLHLWLRRFKATAHDDFDWSIDKRNVSSYSSKEEKEKVWQGV